MHTNLARPAPTPPMAEVVRHALNGPTMGTRYAAIFYAPADIDLAPIATALKASVETVDRQMSTWIEDSDLVRFNRSPVGEWVETPDEMLVVIGTALEIGRVSGGAFDIGVGDLVGAWGFNAKGGRPDAERVAELAATQRRPSHEVVELDSAGRRLRKLAPVSLDLSGIAKGYGVDRLAETLDRFGLADYLVSIDGEVRASGTKSGGSPWRVAVEKPDRTSRDIAGVVEMTDGALATSGDYRHAVDLNGQSSGHTMDPRTGRPLQSGIAAVTVRAPTCMLADAWATALLVLGPEAGQTLAAANGIEAMFMARGD